MGQFDIYRIVTKFETLGVKHQNRYYYRQIDQDISTPNDIANAWLLVVGIPLQDVLNDLTELKEIDVINLDDPSDFGTTVVLAWSGNIIGDAMPPFVAWRFKLLREDRTFRPGRKAYGLVSEGSVQDGVAIAGILPTLNLVATGLESTLVTPVGASSLIPVMAREIPGGGTSAWTGVTGALYVEVSSQNTRKFGRGS